MDQESKILIYFYLSKNQIYILFFFQILYILLIFNILKIFNKYKYKYNYYLVIFKNKIYIN